jgi:hypothetical protein
MRVGMFSGENELFKETDGQEDKKYGSQQAQ